jgi:hypothetical protein
MGRELKRVPLDFQWPIDKTWWGFLMPDVFHEEQCTTCEGTGYSHFALHLQNRWYGKIPFHPTETGSTPFLTDEPAIRALATRNVESAPEFYGSGPEAIEREAQRLADIYNSSWSHHLAQEDVDALLAAERLLDFTHDFVRGEGWIPKDPRPEVLAAEVNRWSLVGMNHIDWWPVVQAVCEKQGKPFECSECKGHGAHEKFPGQRREAERWERTEPPTGEGWQLWETVSEGSPITPVFETAEALVDHLVNVGAWHKKWDRASAERFVHGTGWAPSGMVIGGTFHTPENQP